MKFPALPTENASTLLVSTRATQWCALMFPPPPGARFFSIQCCGKDQEAIVSPLRLDDLAAAPSSESGPVIVVFLDRDRKYITDYGSPRIDALMHKVLASLSRREEKHLGGTTSAQTLQQPDVSSLKSLFHTASLEESPTSISTSSIWVRMFNNWGITFYIRVDHKECFHTYPCVDGGPFHSLPAVYGAINCYLREREDPTMRIDPNDPDLMYRVQESTRERIIRQILYWPDGTRKMRLVSVPIDERRCQMLQMVRALVDKYNDDHNLLGDLAYVLKDVVSYHVFNECISRMMYYHVNFTAKTKEKDDLLFFAETMGNPCDELVVSSICRINPFDEDKGHCYACSSGVKHPKDDAYAGGHSSAGVLAGTYHFHGPREDVGVTAAQLKAEEFRVRDMYKGPRNPKFMKSLMRPQIEVEYPPLRPGDDSLPFLKELLAPAASRSNPCVPSQ